MPDIVLRLDPHLRHLYISPAIEHVTGQPAEQWLGKTAREMGLPADICDQFETLACKATETRTVQYMEFFHNGHWQRSRIVPEYDENGSFFALMGSTDDITEQKRRQLDASFLADLTETFNSLSTQEELLGLLGKRMIQHFGVSSVTCATVNEARDEFIMVYDSNVQNPASVFKPQRLSEYAHEDFLREMKAEHVIVVNDYMSDSRTAPTTEHGTAFPVFPVRAFVLASHVTEGQVDFVLGMQRSEPYTWQKNEVDLLQELTTHVYPQLERIRAQQALRDSERRVQAERQRLYDLFMQAPAAIMVTRGPDHVYELLNPPAVQYLGTHRQYIGKPGREAVPEAEEQGFFDLLDAVYQTGKPFIGNEIPAQFPSEGEGTWTQMYFNFVYQPSYNAAGEIDGVIGYINNVTEAVLTRKRVEESEERFRTLANSMPQLVWSANAEGKIDFFNERLNEYTEVPRNEDGIYEWEAIVHPDDRATIQHDWQRAVKTGHAFEHELRLHMKNGTYRWHLTRGLPIHDANGSITRWYGTKTDIEQLKQLDQQKNSFLGVVSHELKTPVTSAKAFAEVLESRFRKAGDERSALLLAKLSSQMDKLARLISDLLDITRIDAGKLHFHEEFFAFDEVVAAIVEEVQRTTTYTIQQEGRTDKVVYGDRERIGQVITNLLTNAIKYSPDATTVVVTSSTTAEDVTLCIQDFGIGIARDKLPHVFERFFREHEGREDTFSGLGLGLYVCSEIIHRQGGQIWGESEKGQGSTFCFTLPLQRNSQARRQNEMFAGEEETHE